MFFVRIFHQRHENWLHLLIARVLFVRLSWSKVQDIPEHSLLRTLYHQETIVKSGQLLQNMVLNKGSSNNLDTSNFEEFFF